MPEAVSGTDIQQPVMLFVRRYLGFTGGHLKMIQYLRHVSRHRMFKPIVYLSPDSDVAGFVSELGDDLPITFELRTSDAYFLGGDDWDMLDQAGICIDAAPVVNLIQGVHHGEPDDVRYRYLTRPALRICVSQQVHDAIRPRVAAGQEVAVIENGIDLPNLSKLIDPAARRDTILIGALKRPELGMEVARLLQSRGLSTRLLIAKIPRHAFLHELATARMALLLPLPREGFYLPSLEAMALGTPVVTLDCVGGRDISRNRETALVTAPSSRALADAVDEMLTSPRLRDSLVENGFHLAARHSLDREAAHFAALLDAYLARSGFKTASRPA